MGTEWQKYFRVRCVDCKTGDGKMYETLEPDHETVCWPCMTDRMVKEESE